MYLLSSLRLTNQSSALRREETQNKKRRLRENRKGDGDGDALWAQDRVSMLFQHKQKLN